MKNHPKTFQLVKKLAMPLGATVALAFALFAVALPKASHALVEEACYDWECSITTCWVNSACSLPDVGFISYQWDWGDGTSTHTFSETAQHDFNPNTTYNVKLTIKLFGAAGESVTCGIKTTPPIGPIETNTGHCE